MDPRFTGWRQKVLGAQPDERLLIDDKSFGPFDVYLATPTGKLLRDMTEEEGPGTLGRCLEGEGQRNRRIV